MRDPWTVFAADFDPAAGFRTVPQTWQRVAFSLSRVPQVGHSRAFCDVAGFVVIGYWVICSDYGRFWRIIPAIFRDPVKGASRSESCDIIWMMELQYSLYLHIPFCRHRCAYCDFNTYAGQDALRADYVTALCREIELSASSAPQTIPVHTIFFGGGTPSLLTADEFQRILDALKQNFQVDPQAEISLEANPGTVNRAYLTELRQMGFNRISMGMQSAHPEDLHLLEREHSFLDVIQAVKWARQAAFANLNLDLMFGLPFQTLARWQESLERALALEPEHLSLYSLTVEHGTPFQHWTARGLIPTADADLAADMYDIAEERLAQAGFRHYEISNWARERAGGDTYACIHNLQYWRNLPYLGFGAGAHGYAGGYRTADLLGISAYIQRMRAGGPQGFPATPATASLTSIDRQTDIEETMMVGLRLLEEGVSAAQFHTRYQARLVDAYPRQIARLTRLGLLEWAGEGKDALRLTQRGHLLGNQVFVEFVGGEVAV
jgi:oxygen-independent coproporphyrinogen-3 oxidase